MYIVTVFNQIITGEWISAKSGKMDLEIARAVMNRISDKVCQQLRNKEILDYKVVIEIAE